MRDGEAPRLIANTDSETDESAYAQPITGDNRHAFSGETNPLATAATRYSNNRDTQLRIAALSATENSSATSFRNQQVPQWAPEIWISVAVSHSQGPF